MHSRCFLFSLSSANEMVAARARTGDVTALQRNVISHPLFVWCVCCSAPCFVAKRVARACRSLRAAETTMLEKDL